MAYEKSKFYINSVGDRYNLGVCIVVYVFFLYENIKYNNYIQREWIDSTITYHMVRIIYTGTQFVDRHMYGYVGSKHLVALISVAVYFIVYYINFEKTPIFCQQRLFLNAYVLFTFCPNTSVSRVTTDL